MWQRIQTLYFVLVLLLMIAATLLPNADFINSTNHLHYQLDSRGIAELTSKGVPTKTVGTNPCTFLFGIILFVTTFCIFRYNNRKVQFRLATINLLLIFAYIVILAVYLVIAKNKLQADVFLKVPVGFPVIALILEYLAMRGIMKDEKLVKSMDRLR